MTRASSPCIRVCILDPETGLCEGCGRTREEIARWYRIRRRSACASWRSCPSGCARPSRGPEPEPDKAGDAWAFAAPVLFVAAAILVGVFADEPIGGFSALEARPWSALVGIALLMAGSIVASSARAAGPTACRRSPLGGILVALVVTYASATNADRARPQAIGEVAPGRTVVTPGARSWRRGGPTAASW